jgi:hypothetical protein
MFRHCDFHGPGAFAVRRAFKLDAALPDGRRLSNDGCEVLSSVQVMKADEAQVQVMR